MPPEPATARDRSQAYEDLLGVRSSKGRYYREYRHSNQDLERTLMAVDAVSWVLADASSDARSLVEGTLPVIAELLHASAVVLVSGHPALEGAQVCLPPPPRGCAPPDERLAEELVRHAAALTADGLAAGVVRTVPELGATLLLVPLPARVPGYVVAAVPARAAAGRTDLAILGTLTNQLAGAIESCRRLEESETLRRAADRARQAADEHAAALARRNELLKRTRHDLVAARECQVLAEERQRIARDLHDSVAQHVLSMGMQVQWCTGSVTEPEVAERLTEVRDLARLTVERIRQAIFELSGSDELQQGLVPALRRLGEQHTDHGLAIGVRVLGPPVQLPQATERVLYMAAKEALFNVVVHAEATRAAVHLVQLAGEVRLHVSDDGLGRAPALREHLRRARRECADGYHRGLANLEERVRLAGGRLSIHDVPGGGIRLQVSLAVDDEEIP